MANASQNLRKKMLQILQFCQANKGDLLNYAQWKDDQDANKKLFYTYYSGLFCRILYRMENSQSMSNSFFLNCDQLLNKYDWYKIQDVDIAKFKTDEPHYCEVSEALEFLPGIDDVAWGKTAEGKGVHAICINVGDCRWSYSDVRGSIK